jgi:hypothetical protein
LDPQQSAQPGAFFVFNRRTHEGERAMHQIAETER